MIWRSRSMISHLNSDWLLQSGGPSSSHVLETPYFYFYSRNRFTFSRDIGWSSHNHEYNHWMEQASNWHPCNMPCPHFLWRRNRSSAPRPLHCLPRTSTPRRRWCKEPTPCWRSPLLISVFDAWWELVISKWGDYILISGFGLLIMGWHWWSRDNALFFCLLKIGLLSNYLVKLKSRETKLEDALK